MAKFRDTSEMGKRGERTLPQVNRLHRLAGQMSGIARMIEENRAPLDILTQFKAVRSALAAVEEQVLNKILQEGIERALQASDRVEMQKRLEELFQLQTEKFHRSKDFDEI